MWILRRRLLVVNKVGRNGWKGRISVEGDFGDIMCFL